VTTTVVVFAGVVVIGLGLYLCSPSFVVMLALPASFLVFRVGGSGGGNNLSISDLVLVVAAVAAFPLMHWSGARELKKLLVLLAIYQATTLFSVVDHANRYDIVEWFHQLVLVGGSAVVGYVIFERGRAHLALASFLAIAAGLSAFTTVEFAAHGGHPLASLPLGFQKNPLGILFAAAVLIAQFKPGWSGLQGRWVQVAKYTCLVGVISVQSRQSMIALVVVVLVIYLRRRGLSKRPKLLIASLVPVGIVAYVTTRGQETDGSNFNSVAVRETWLHQSLTLWQRFPVFGVGERFWYTGIYGINIQPPNAEVSMLATGGVVGLLGFLVLVLGALYLLWKLPAEAGTMALAVLLAHVVEGQFDIFWVSPIGSMPWIIVGMGLAAAAAMTHLEPDDDGTPSAPSPPDAAAGRRVRGVVDRPRPSRQG